MRNAIAFSLLLLILTGSACAQGAVGVESGSVPYMVAFLAGVISVLSPCSVLLLFGYMSVIFKEQEGFWTRTLAFFFGLSLTWVLLGISASGLGSLIAGSQVFLSQVAGLFLMAFGLMYLFAVHIPTISISRRVDTTLLGMFVFGVLFTLAWIPCVGPILGSILVMASMGSPAQGALLLFLYATGFMLAVILIFLFIERSGRRLHIGGATIRGRRISYFNMIAGVFLTALGLIYLLDQMSALLTLLSPLAEVAFAIERVVVGNPGAAGLAAFVIILLSALLFWKRRA